MSEEIKETKKKRTSKKAKKEIETNNRFVDVIEKMEEQTKKVHKTENIEDKNTAK